MTHIAHSEKVLCMRIFLLVILLSFNLQSWTKAEDISDFQIEGISVGDSLLKLFSKKEIESNMAPYVFKSDRFKIFEINQPSIFQDYESLQVAFKKDDHNYNIYGISAAIFFNQNILNCEEKKISINNELKDLFRNLESSSREGKLRADPTGESSYTRIAYYFPDGHFIGISCYDWSESITESKNWIDVLRVEIYSKEYNTWLSEAY